MMSNLSERDRRALQWGGIGVVGVVLFLVAGAPLLDRWDSLNQEIDKNQKELRAIETNVQDAAGATLALRELRESATIYPDRAALDQQTAAMLQQLESLPSYRTIAVRRLEGLPLRDEQTYYRSSVSLQFSGNLGNVHGFLQEIEDALPALKVERLTLTADAKDTSKVEGQMVITGYAVVMGGARA
jgi:hypothetical protein